MRPCKKDSWVVCSWKPVLGNQTQADTQALLESSPTSQGELEVRERRCLKEKRKVNSFSAVRDMLSSVLHTCAST